MQCNLNEMMDGRAAVQKGDHRKCINSLASKFDNKVRLKAVYCKIFGFSRVINYARGGNLNLFSIFRILMKWERQKYFLTFFKKIFHTFYLTLAAEIFLCFPSFIDYILEKDVCFMFQVHHHNLLISHMKKFFFFD